MPAPSAASIHDVQIPTYHRNTAGNRALYRLLLMPADAAHDEAARLRLAYLVDCPGMHGELGTPRQNSLRARLEAGKPPAWLRPLPGAGAAVYAVGR